jgi:hypothetical protein
VVEGATQQRLTCTRRNCWTRKEMASVVTSYGSKQFKFYSFQDPLLYNVQRQAAGHGSVALVSVSSRQGGHKDGFTSPRS